MCIYEYNREVPKVKDLTELLTIHKSVQTPFIKRIKMTFKLSAMEETNSMTSLALISVKNKKNISLILITNRKRQIVSNKIWPDRTFFFINFE